MVRSAAHVFVEMPVQTNLLCRGPTKAGHEVVCIVRTAQSWSLMALLLVYVLTIMSFLSLF